MRFCKVVILVSINSRGRVTHTCVSKLTIIVSDNGLSPGRRRAIIWTNAGIMPIGPLGTNFGEIFIAIHTFSFKKIYLKMSSGKWRPFCLGLNVLKPYFQWTNPIVNLWFSSKAKTLQLYVSIKQGPVLAYFVEAGLTFSRWKLFVCLQYFWICTQQRNNEWLLSF